MNSEDGHNSAKAELIPDGITFLVIKGAERLLLQNQPAVYQLVGRVMAYQGYDG